MGLGDNRIGIRDQRAVKQLRVATRRRQDENRPKVESIRQRKRGCRNALEWGLRLPRRHAEEPGGRGSFPLKRLLAAVTLAPPIRYRCIGALAQEDREVTFSIAALCRRTGEVGCALATSSTAAGARAPFVAPGRGAVLSQARSDPALGLLGVKLLEAGRSAEEALSEMVASTPHSSWRQLAVVDQAGNVDHFTGSEPLAFRGARVGDAAIAIGNALSNDEVVGMILQGFEAAPDLPLANRLLTALEHGERAGGETYPLRSAALKVARPGVPFPILDLRVDLSENPIADLRRIWVEFDPMVEAYVTRALDPQNSPPAAAIEGHPER